MRSGGPAGRLIPLLRQVIRTPPEANSLTTIDGSRWESHAKESPMVPFDVPLLTAVDVWCASTARWVPGFRVAEVRSDGQMVLLGRDGGPPLPEPFHPSYLRATESRPSSPWGALATA